MSKKKGYEQLLAEECFNRTEQVERTDGQPNIVLDGHQQDAMLEIAAALEDGEKIFSVVHPGGSGKTVLEAAIVQASQAAKARMGEAGEGRKDIVLAVERSLIRGVRAHLERTLEGDVGIWGMGEKDLEPPVVVASIQSLQRNKQGLHNILPSTKVDLIIGDEADKYLTEARTALLKRYRDSVRIGLTATPEWSDGRHIDDAWGETLHQLKLKEGIVRGINVPPFFHLYEADVDGDSIRIAGDDYEPASLDAAMKSVEIENAIPDVYRNLVPESMRGNFPTLVYVPSLDTLEATTERLRKEFDGSGLNISSWSGDISSNRLRDEIDAFREGNIDILVLCEMGGRGLNLPRARLLIDAYPTLSANKLEQRHSRALRKIRPGTPAHAAGFKKDFATIAQILPVSNSFRPLTLLDVLDCWPDYEPGRVLGFQERPGAGVGSPGGPVDSEELATILENMRKRPIKSRVTLLEEVDVLKALQERMKFEDVPQADEDGFIYLDKK